MNTPLRRRLLHLSILTIVPLGAGLGARAFAQPAPTPTSTADTATQAPSATLAVVAPAAEQPPGVPFQFTTNLSELRFSDKVREWSTYDFELGYDDSVVAIDSVAPGLCQPKNVWAMVTLSPTVTTGCVGQLSTATGVFETFTATCIKPGSSQLHIESRTTLASESALPFALTLVDGSVACAEGPTLPTPTPAATPTPASKPGAWRPGAATLTAIGPSGAQSIGMPFEFTTNLSALTLTESSPSWGGYDFELAYDPSVIEIVSVEPDICKPMGTWANPVRAPHVISGCYAQEETSTGTLETMTARCLKEGSSPLRIVPSMEPGAEFAGTNLFDENAVSLSLTLVEGSVTCGGGAAAASSTPE